MKRATIRLRGISGEVKGKVWEHPTLLRAGRLASLEIVLDDSSVSRRHAEVRLAEAGVFVRDLESTNGTYVNGVRIGTGEQQLRPRDIVQFGKVAVIVEPDEASSDGPPSNQHVVAAVPSSFEGGLDRLAFTRDQLPRAGDQLRALLRAGHHAAHIQNEDQLLDNILNDAVSVLDAQRGAIVLAEGDATEPQFKLRALAVGHGESAGRFHYSKKLTARVFGRGESVLYSTLTQDDEIKVTQSMHEGAMASVICVLLRTPRRRLGVMHLDRGLFQNPFSEEELYLADALAAHVSAAIEAAQMLRKQKEFFLKTITVLAQTVELKDDYTGLHTQRVTRYAAILAKQLEVSDEQMEWIKLGTPLHDIGKIGVDDAILRKPGRLTAAEFAAMQEHTTKGAEILSSVPELRPILPIVRNHHERWDGTGYPDRLAGEDIPLLARIVAVADAFDAMTSDRPYHPDRKGRPAKAAFVEVEKQAGRQFDPRCAAAFLAVSEQIVQAMKELLPASEIGSAFFPALAPSGCDTINPAHFPTNAHVAGS